MFLTGHAAANDLAHQPVAFQWEESSSGHQQGVVGAGVRSPLMNFSYEQLCHWVLWEHNRVNFDVSRSVIQTAS